MIPRCVRTVARVARTASLAAAALLVSASMLAAQATGKIEGRVRDNQGTPIANAQVFVVGTAFSALTNAQGYYFINNIPVGSVDMRAAFVGYRPMVAQGVLIRGGQTGTQDFSLEASVVTVQDVVVTAERPLVPRDQVTSKPAISGDLTDQLPADRIGQVLALQPGVVASSGSGLLSIRGGRTDASVTYVDGVPVQAGNRGTFGSGIGQTQQNGLPTGLAVATNDFQEATITTGAAGAEFGNSTSGVISIETKTGGQKFQGNFGYETDGWAGATHNNSLGYTRFQLGFSGPVATNLTFSVNGALEGQLSPGTGKDIQAPLYTPAGIDTTMAVTTTDQVTHMIDTSYVPISQFAVFRGSCDSDVPSTSAAQANGMASNYGVDCQGVRSPRSATSNYAVGGKLNYTFGAGDRLTFSVNRSQNQGRIFSYTSQLAPGTTEGFFNSSNVFTLSGSFNLNRSAERALALETYLSYQQDRIMRSPLTAQSELDTRDPFMGFMVKPLDFRFNFDNFPLDDQLVDNFHNNTKHSRRGPYDYDDPTVLSTFGVADDYRNNPYGTQGWAESGGPSSTLTFYRENRIVGRANLDWQADRYNRMKFGGDFTKYDMFLYRQGLTSQAFSDVWHEKPNKYSGFASDRLDLGDVVIDLGLRYDWYKTGASRSYDLVTDPAAANYGQYVYFPRYSSMKSTADSNVILVPDQAHNYLSPHIQVAFPVTQRTNFRLSYAHQVQTPDFAAMLAGINTDLAITNTNNVYGSDLDFGKTITFEFGVRHEFSPDMVLDISAYNKDNLADASGRLIHLYDPFKRQVNDIRLATNADFGNTRGVDVQLQRRIGNLFTGQVTYTYQDAKNTGSDPLTYINFGSRIVDALSGGNALPPQAILPTATSRTHSLAAVASFNFPDGWNQGTMLGTVLQNVGLNATARYASGTPYTPCPTALNGNDGITASDGFGGSACAGSQVDNQVNSVRLPAFKQFDLRLTKGFKIRNLDLTAYADARNVLNLTNVLAVFQATRDVKSALNSELSWRADSASWASEAIRNGVYDNSAVDLTFQGANMGGCGSWVNSSGESSSVNCAYIYRAEERFGNGDHIFTTAEQRRASNTEYLVGQGLNNFYGAPRRVRLGLEVNF